MAFPTSASEVTLVAPTILTFTLTNDNPSNTSLIDLSGSSDAKPAYIAKTEFTNSKTLTNVTNAEGEVIASLEWREMLPDKVTIPGKPSMALSSWMRSGILPNSAVSFQDDKGRKYQWKNVAAGLEMEASLHASDAPGGPIAAFRKSRVNRLAKTSTPATFLLTARGREILDTCIVSFLFLEKKRRMRENSSQNRADSDALGSASLRTSRGMVSGGGV